MRDAGYGMQDAGYGMQDAGYGMQDAGYGMQDVRESLLIPYPESRILYPSGIPIGIKFRRSRR